MIKMANNRLDERSSLISRKNGRSTDLTDLTVVVLVAWESAAQGGLLDSTFLP